MSIDDSGLNGKVVCVQPVMIDVKKSHPMIQLADVLCWDDIANIVLPDLKSTTGKGKWWMGRPLRLRIHLGAYLVQQLFNLTDRETEYHIKDNAAYQLFCGLNIVKKWHYPDHTKIEEFRSRLSSDTQSKLGNKIAKHAVDLGFADPADVDIDSTVQEANMLYPTDSHLLCKLGSMAKQVAQYLNDKLSAFKIKPMEVNLKKIKSAARACFFLKSTASQEEKQGRLKNLLDYVTKEVSLVINNARCTGEAFMNKMPWNIKRIFCHLIEKGKKYLSDVSHFVSSGSMVPDKILSFHLNDVRCITKNKPGKKYQFGRVFQIGRIKGNFLFTGKCHSPNQSDKQSVKLMLDSHSDTFAKASINSAATDKGYYSANNEKIMLEHGIKDIGIQRPVNIKRERTQALAKYRENELIDRRAGIEPLIGHVKHGGQLGRSRMKSDKTIESSGYASILGFNLRQLIRYKTGKVQLEAT